MSASHAEWNPNSNNDRLSIRIVSGLLFWYFAAWACLTIITLGAQAMGLPFKYYFRISLLAVAAVGVAAIVRMRRSISRGPPTRSEQEGAVIAGLAVICVAAAALSLAYHTTGRLFLDDFYLTANPVYYSQHAQVPMSFEARAFYSGGAPIISVGFLTAGAYETILAIPAYLLKINYVVVYYRLAAVANAILLVLSLFFALAHFCDDTRAALIGTFAAICLLSAMSENSWAIGGLAFVHGYEGKAILILDGVPLLAAYSLELLSRPSRRTWLQMFLFLVAMTGTSTSSFMIMPLLGVVLFLAWVIANRNAGRSGCSWARGALLYLGTYTYLIAFAALVALGDKAQNAVLFNLGYPADFLGYLRAFLSSSTWPATVVFSMASWALAVLVTRDRKRAFIGSWFALAIILFLNPVSAGVLLLLFRGIYFRLFYIVLNPLFAGVAAAQITSEGRSRFRPRLEAAAIMGIAGLALLPVVLSPTSLILSPRYTLGSWTPTDDFPPAQKIVNNAPEGLMLAPYPISGTIRMISSAYPQLEGRSDMLTYYLGLQGRAEEAKLRLQANEFLSGNAGNFSGFRALIAEYPEIRSIVFSRGGLAEVDSSSLRAFLIDQGFAHHLGIEKYVVYWR